MTWRVNVQSITIKSKWDCDEKEKKKNEASWQHMRITEQLESLANIAAITDNATMNTFCIRLDVKIRDREMP